MNRSRHLSVFGFTEQQWRRRESNPRKNPGTPYVEQPGIIPSLEARFWARVEKTDDCWLWTGRQNAKGYGRVFTYSRRAGRTCREEMAHRVSYQLAYGPIPDGLLVCHRCDNPPCIRPNHLFVGTNLDNVYDARAKLRLAKKLTPADVYAIRAACDRGETHRSIADRYGLACGTVTKIKLRQRWSWLPERGAA